MTGKSLCAWINQTQVGTLQEAQGIWCFEYTPAWRQAAKNFALSPHLPLQASLLQDGASQRPVQWYFDNLLPEEHQRVLLAADARLSAADAFGLLAYYGAESAGSLILLPPGAPAPAAALLHALPDATLEARIRQMPRIALTHGAPKRMSLAGAQHKLAVVFQDDQLFEPAEATPSTHILKPDHPGEDYPHSVINEWFVMRLAQRLGLLVPPVHRRYVPSPVYLIERFDRVLSPQGWQRRHVIDACQLLGLDRSFKYSQGSVATLERLAQLCRSPATVRIQLFDWLVFNVLIGNGDAHLKNLSFLVSEEGIALAPFYDLLSVATYETRTFDKTGWPDQAVLAWPIFNETRFGGLTQRLLLEAGQALKLSASTAKRRFDQLHSRIWQAAQTLYAETEAENAQISATRPELSATMGGELRCLRAMLYVVIQEMVKKLA